MSCRWKQEKLYHIHKKLITVQRRCGFEEILCCASFTQGSATVEADMEGGIDSIQEQQSVRQPSQDDLQDQEDHDNSVPNQPSIGQQSPEEVSKDRLNKTETYLRQNPREYD